MRYIRWVSNLIAVAGVAMIAAGVAFHLGPTVILIGMMLAVAGVVKIVAVGIWHGTGGFGAPLQTEEQVVPTRPKRKREKGLT
jgi:hypothetical protein